ncbi:hypothetical protein [Krasilnikovia sp. MM14-A1004]|uniref:hypothetical protein n=1 Tax=Krasilnikovia sp. MM14-A1004 TaxID=3373541 RepID=UPI00399CD7CD
MRRAWPGALAISLLALFLLEGLGAGRHRIRVVAVDASGKRSAESALEVTAPIR